MGVGIPIIAFAYISDMDDAVQLHSTGNGHHAWTYRCGTAAASEQGQWLRGSLRWIESATPSCGQSTIFGIY